MNKIVVLSHPLKCTNVEEYRKPLFKLHFVLLLFLLSNFLVAVFLLQWEALPAATDFSHTLFHGQVVQLPVRQHFLRKLLIAISERAEVKKQH